MVIIIHISLNLNQNIIHDINIIEKIKQNKDKWIKAKLILENIPENKNFGKFTGNVIFAASPILVKRGNIVFFNYDTTDEVSQVLRKYKVKQFDEVIRKHILRQSDSSSKLVKSISTKNLSGVIYGVGQGNFIKLNCGNEIILFDVGFTISEDYEMNPIIKNSSEIVHSIEPNVVILSHWDLDHIIGVTYMNSGYIYGNKNF